MTRPSLLRMVIDTNVVFEGLTRQGASSGIIMDAWLAGLARACVSSTLAYEYVEVLSRKLSSARWQEIQPVLGTLLSLADFVTIHYTWRPTSPDPADDHVVDCAMNSGAVLVTWNVRDFRTAQKSLGLRVITPVEAVVLLTR